VLGNGAFSITVPDKSAERRTAPLAGMISPQSSRRAYKFVEAVVMIAAGSPLSGVGEERGGPNGAAIRSHLCRCFPSSGES